MPILVGSMSVMGVTLSRLLGSVLGPVNRAGQVMTTLAGTGAVFVGVAGSRDE
ncbi:hypothetical protein [Hydrogenophaga sp.]|uniref:hypothetical protein n=1 Tax=Hydrogenophaga sp. TaxID=1904254 RepID=UPI0025C401F3|nr:hypothetical protein [Hydrogenophaga sp.]